MADKPKTPAVQEVVGPEVAPDLGGPGGENVHVPTEANRKTVRMLVSAGRPQEEIAVAIGVAPKTLRHHYRSDLDEGTAEVNKLVLGKLFKKINDDDTASIIFFCKTRLGMKETTQHEFPNGIPPAGDASAVSDERTRELIQEALNDV